MMNDERSQAIADMRRMKAEYMNGKEMNEVTERKCRSFDTAIKAIEQTTWIPVSERLPEEDVDVLVVVELPDGKDGTLQRIEIASFGLMYPLSSEKGWITNNFTRLDRTEVIAWMPLPEPYKGE